MPPSYLKASLESFPFVSNREGIPKELSMRESDGIDSFWGEHAEAVLDGLA
jgi:hypothetical protein